MPERQVKITLVNEDQNRIFSEFYEPVDDDDTIGYLFRLYQSEYGRCTSKVYKEIDGQDGVPIGWYFESRQRYTDTGEPYLRGAWVTLVTKPEVPRPRPIPIGAPR